MIRLGSQSEPLDYAGCIFDSNIAVVSGGAVYESDVNLQITYVNSLFVANEAKSTSGGEGGGAIFNGGSTAVSYVNCTFVGNKATGDEGGGIRVANSKSTEVTNCIFWDNCDGFNCLTQDESAQIHLGNSSSSATVTNCTIEGCQSLGFCDEDTNKAVEPAFVGTGAHPYQLQDDAANDLLIDDGDGDDLVSSACDSVNMTTFDLAGIGNPRFVRKGTDCGIEETDFIDIGAYEVQ